MDWQSQGLDIRRLFRPLDREQRSVITRDEILFIMRRAGGRHEPRFAAGCVIPQRHALDLAKPRRPNPRRAIPREVLECLLP
jgi:hypothetical protein